MRDKDRILNGGIDLTAEEYLILQEELKKSIEQKRVEIELLALRELYLDKKEIDPLTGYYNAEIEKRTNLLRKIVFYEYYEKISSEE